MKASKQNLWKACWYVSIHIIYFYFIQAELWRFANFHCNLFWSLVTFQLGKYISNKVSTAWIDFGMLNEFVKKKNVSEFFFTEFIGKIVDKIHPKSQMYFVTVRPKCMVPKKASYQMDFSTIEFLLMRKTHKIKWFINRR